VVILDIVAEIGTAMGASLEKRNQVCEVKQPVGCQSRPMEGETVSGCGLAVGFARLIEVLKKS
jgi:hypothetical protein